MRLKSDLFELLLHAAEGTLDKVEPVWDRRVAPGRGDGRARLPGRAAQGRRDHRRAARHARPASVPRRHHAAGRPAAHQRRPRAVRHRVGRTACAWPSSARWPRCSSCISTARSGATTSATARSSPRIETSVLERPSLNARHQAAPLALQPQPLPVRGSALARTLLRLGGWRVLFHGLPGPQGVIGGGAAHLELGLHRAGAGQVGHRPAGVLLGQGTRCSAFPSSAAGCAGWAACRWRATRRRGRWGRWPS